MFTNHKTLQAKAHEQLGQLLPREKHKQAYQESLKQRYKHLPEVKRILRHRHLPAVIYKVSFELCLGWWQPMTWPMSKALAHERRVRAGTLTVIVTESQAESLCRPCAYVVTPTSLMPQ